MAFSLWEKVEAIRQEPEHVRMRYVMFCVGGSMVVIVGIWLLSVRESFTRTAGEIPDVVEQGKQGIGGIPSRNDLFEQSAPLRIEDKEVDGSQFFEQQLEKKNGEGATISE